MSWVLYALAEGAPASLGSGAQRERLHLVKSRGLSVIVGDAEPAVLSASALRTHDAVVRRLWRRARALLPFRFGAGVAGPRALAELLEGRTKSLAAALRSVRGAGQMTIRIFGESAAAPMVPELLASLGPGARFLTERRALRAFESSAPELDPLRPALAGVVRAEKVRRHASAPLLASAYHLVPLDQLRRYRAVIRAAKLPVRLELSGPFPPYAFASEELG